MRRITAPAVILAVLVLAAGRTHAWGPVGHHLVARIALTRMSEPARAAAKAILGDDDFVTSATWADDVRQARPETYNWHFVDIPYGEARYDAARDCKAADRGDCVIAAITRLRAKLADAATPALERREALKFIIHFVGDLHEPLHTIDNHDKGGNDVRVIADAGRLTNLHAMWDSGIMNGRHLDEQTYAAMLLSNLDEHPLSPSELQDNVVSWSEASHKIAEDVVYKYPQFVKDETPKEPITLDQAYLKRAEPIIDRQLQLAGARLAVLLNATLR